MSTVSAPLVRLEDVSLGYGHAAVLRDITLDVGRGQFTGIVGPSGSGKTTLLRLLLGTVTPGRGTLTRQPGTAVSYVPQLETVNWSFPVTVGECGLMSRLTTRWIPRATPQEKREVHDVLDRLGIADLAARRIRGCPAASSNGCSWPARRGPAAARRATSGVDVQTAHEVLHLLDELNREGLAIVLTTHDLHGMTAHLPHLIGLQQRVVASGPPSEVIRPDMLEQVFGARMEVLQHLGMQVVVDSPPGLAVVRRAVCGRRSSTRSATSSSSRAWSRRCWPAPCAR